VPPSEDARRATAGGDPLTRRLVIRPGALGDFVVSIPALETLAPSEIWCTLENVPLAKTIAPCASPISGAGLDLLELGLAPEPLFERLRGFDEIISWYGSNRTEFREAVGAMPFRFLPALPPEGESVHAVDFYLAQVGGKPGASPRLALPPVKSRDFAAIHPFSGSFFKNWPLESFQAVAASLPLPVEWCAGPEEVLPGARRFESRFDLARWLMEARCYLGNDSGVSHLAAAVGTPVVALFGPTAPGVWSPRGRRVTILDQRQIRVEQVTAAVLDCL